MFKDERSSSNCSSSSPQETPLPWTLSLQTPAGVALIIFAALIAYLPALSGGFIWDDDLHLINNPLIKSTAGFYQFWDAIEKQVWPVSNASLWLEWRLWGINPTGYHVTNLILHISEALLIWIILQKLSIPGAFLAALIFTVHPVNVESVAWIAQRKNLLAMLFFLLSILCYLKFEILRAQVPGLNQENDLNRPLPTVHRSLYYWLSLATFVLAMLSKGSVTVLPVLLLVIVWWRRPLTQRDLVRITPFFLVAGVLTGVNLWFQTYNPHDVIRYASFVQRLLGAGGVVWFYLSKALLPLNLVFVYPAWHIEAGNLLWWLPLLSVMVVTAVLWRHRRGWSRPFLFAWGYFCVALVPVLGFANVYFMISYSLVADHYQHIAIIGVIALAAAGWSCWRQRTRPAATIAAAALICIFMYLTWRQSLMYKDVETLYQTTIDRNPSCLMAHNNLGIVLITEGRLDEAMDHFRQSLRLKADNLEAYTGLGVVSFTAGRLQEAIEYFQQALRLKPDYPEVYYNLGIALDKAGQLPEAIENYQQALHLAPNDVQFHNKLGTTLAKEGRLSEAIEHYQQALRLNPNYHEAYNNLGGALENLGRLPEAIEHYRQALRLKADFPEAHSNLGFILDQAGQWSEAVEHYQAALKLAPDCPEVLNNLGLVMAKTGLPQEAIEHYQQALRLKPDYANTHNNLADALVNTGRLPEAVEHYRQALRLKPDFFEAHNNLGVVLSNIGRTQEAIEHFQKALSLKSDSIETYMNLALAYAKLQQSDQALTAAQQALELARSKGQTDQARQIEDWLNAYRASLSK